MAKTICVSAGHTDVLGKDRGAVGSGYVEGVEATKLRDAVSAYLREKGFKVLEDGIDGDNEPLTKALALARQADIACELHFNAAGTPKATGIEVLAHPRDKRLAQKVAQAIAKATGLKLRGDLGFKPEHAGQHHRLAFVQASGMIVEVCFISNPFDMSKYAKNFQAIAQGIADALAAG